jgi:hypothetical protein
MSQMVRAFHILVPKRLHWQVFTENLLFSVFFGKKSILSTFLKESIFKKTLPIVPGKYRQKNLT